MNLTESHITSINKALVYIETHLEDELSLSEISKHANYSPYHFHRIFKVFTKETLNNYIARKRVERASADLLHRESLTIAQLSVRYGFSSNSSFTRAFKKFYGMNPSEFRKSSQGKYSKIRQVKSKNRKVNTTFEVYVCDSNQNYNSKMSSEIEVKSIEPITTAGITCIGKQDLAAAFNQLINWAGPQGLLRTPNFKIATIFYDSFKITAPDKVRMTAAVMVDPSFETNGRITKTTLEGGQYIIGHYTIGVEQFPLIWSNLFKWMNDNGYKKRNLAPFEIYHNDFNQHPEKKCIVDMYIPVE